MLGSSPNTLYEGVWTIEDVTPINEQTLLVNFKTGWFKTEEEAEDPSERQIWDYGPMGESIQSVAIGIEHLPTMEDFNSGNRSQIYEVLTETLDLEVKEED